MPMLSRALLPDADPAPPVLRVRDRLLRAILAHRLPPDAKLTEEELAEICDTSRAVVRAALQALAHSGIVRIERHRGAFVANPSPTQAREVFQARALLEPAAATWAAERATPADIAWLTGHAAREAQALAAGQFGRALAMSGEFHCAIAGIADHGVVAELVAALTARSALVIALYWRRRDAICECHAHTALIAALAARDGAAAAEVMRGHLTDLLTSLDLSPRDRTSVDLAQALADPPD